MKIKHTRILGISALLATCLGFLSACGTDSNPFGSPVSGGNGANQAGANTGNVQLKLVLNKQLERSVVAGTTSIRLTGFDAKNVQVLTQTLPISTVVNLNNVPVTVVTLKVEYLNAGGTVVGESTLPVTITTGGIFIINDPNYDPVVLNVTTNFLSGTFTVTGADSGTVKGGILNGALTFDGQGRVTGGAITRKDATAQNSTTAFNVTGGTYTIAGDRNVDVSLTTDKFPLKVHGRASLDTLGESVYADMWGDNGSTDALSGFVYLQKQGVTGAGVTPGLYNLSGLSVGLFGTPGYYNGNITLAANGNITGGSFDGPTGSSSAVQGGTFTVTGTAISGSMQIAGAGTLTFTGSVGSDHYIAFNGVSSTSSDSLFFAGIPDQGSVSLPNVPSTMTLLGMRTVNGGLDGSSSISIGAGTLLGGGYTLYPATTVPIIPSSSALAQSTFTVGNNGVITGNSGASASQPVRLVRGFFSQTGSVYFGSLDGGQSALAGGQGFAVLAK